MKNMNFAWLLILFSALMSSGVAKSQEVSFTYLCPHAGSENLNPEQNIILKYSEGIDKESVNTEMIHITGSKSGPVKYTHILSDDHTTLLLKPLHPLKQGEHIQVIYSGGIHTKNGQAIESFEFGFSIIDYDRDLIFAQSLEKNTDQEELSLPNPGQENYTFSRKDNNLPPDFPAPVVFNYGEHDDEYIFLNTTSRNSSLPWAPYLTIIDSYGTPVYYDKGEFNRNNFGLLPNGLLCFAINTLENNTHEKYFIIDSTYNIIDSVNVGNGYILDSHDMLLLDNGHYLVISYDPQPVNMSLIVPGGNPDAIVTGLVIQEVDNSENVFFQWRSWDHFEITDATDDINLLAPTIDYVHANALEIDADGHILLSSRHLDEITKINFNTGQIIWRFGPNSENNMFQVMNDPTGFSHQHDVRKTLNGHYTVFDNGNLNTPQVSRACEYVINQNNMTATLVWNFQHGSQIYSSFAGSFRSLDNGQHIIGWGGNFPIAVTVLNEDNSLSQQLILPDFVSSYRAYKYHWETNIFDTQDKLSMGNYAGYDDWKQNKLYIFNTSNKLITITSVHHHSPEFEVLSELPMSIFPGSNKSIEIGFHPSVEGEYNDRFTLNFDNADNTRRVARQLQIIGYSYDDTPSVFFIPEHNSTNISPDSEIILNFNEPVKKAFGGEIQNEDIQYMIELKETFFDGADISFTGTINEDKTQMIITPDQLLMENHQYYVVLKGDIISDADGNIMTLDEECYFSTGLLIGMPEISNEDVRVYPNPFYETIFISNPERSSAIIQVFNIKGQLIRKLKSKEASLQIDLSEQTGGLYFIHIMNEASGETSTAKVIKY